VLSKLEKELKTYDIVALRRFKIEEAENSISYHKQHYERDVAICNYSNEWMNTLLKSL